jgi:dimethylargininase
MFKNALVRIPGKSLTRGITSHPELGAPDYELALAQHGGYIRAIESLGITVTVLPPLEEYPDSCFVEDVAILSERCAVITNPGAPSRRDETAGIIPAIREFYPETGIHRIADPGTIEGGDVMRVEDTFYVGLSARTNQEGIRQFQEILKPYGYQVIPVPLKEVLHLKTGINYLSDRRFLVSGEFTGRPDFAAFERTIVSPEEAYAANSLWMNGSVLVPAGFPQTEAAVRALGYPVLRVDTSEYRKIDGGLSCLSLRF